MRRAVSEKVIVAMSGGVDSAVAALLLKQRGYRIQGMFMKNWTDPLAAECPWEKEARDFHRICKQIGIPGTIATFEHEYRKKVVEYLINGYRRGVTPNPDMLCNREIKFKVFLQKARSLGADYIATGHYVQKIKKENICELHQARDLDKDQSYFLALLNQAQIRRAIFPIGRYKKTEIRKIAQRAHIPVYDKKDSQGICFIGKVKFSDFIRQYIRSKPGLVKFTNGKIIGEHEGLAFYTIGQRHGLGIGGGRPYYVADKDMNTNTLYVTAQTSDSTLYTKKIIVSSMNWISGKQPSLPQRCAARIRYRQPKQYCHIHKNGEGLVFIFDKKQRAATTGQFAVCYQRTAMLGGGVISRIIN